jgi:hypothetical protein
VKTFRKFDLAKNPGNIVYYLVWKMRGWKSLDLFILLLGLNAIHLPKATGQANRVTYSCLNYYSITINEIIVKKKRRINF